MYIPKILVQSRYISLGVNRDGETEHVGMSLRNKDLSCCPCAIVVSDPIVEHLAQSLIEVRCQVLGAVHI